MPTLAQLRSEPYWDREIVTAELDWLGDEICRRTGRPRSAFGTKGNEAHLSGAHRSQEWLKASRYATNRTYTVQSGLSALQARYIAGADYTPGAWGTPTNRALMRAQTKRLIDAMRDGRLAGLREVIGTLDGKTVTAMRADGATFRADSSHLDHWHLTLDRTKVTDRALMERILAVALGEDDMSATAETQIAWLDGRVEALGTGTDTIAKGRPGAGQRVWLVGAVKALASRADEQRLRDEAILAAVRGDDDQAEILARIDQRAAELAAGQQALRADLVVELAPALAAAVREELGEVPPEQLDGAMDRALRRVLGSLASQG